MAKNGKLNLSNISNLELLDRDYVFSKHFPEFLVIRDEVKFQTQLHTALGRT